MLPACKTVDATRLEIRRAAGRIGAEVCNVQLSGELDASVVTAIRRALLDYKVLFFRRQHAFTLEIQEAFASLFGELVPHPTVPKIEGTQSALNIFYADGSTASNAWHTDDTFLDVFPAAGVLTPVILPSFGGDTLWANAVTAYEHLPESLREFAHHLWALHSNTSEYNSARRHPNAVSTAYECEHPIVRVHPETGERALLLGFHAQRLVGLSRQDSERLMNLFQDHISRPENTVRWSWQPADVVFWDNCSTQHYGIGDFNETRQLHRVSLRGEAPVSVDGRHSVLRRKEEWRPRRD